ncbi:MAG: hypothetical protein M1832_001969 [Thelocarpon impressellum]|nr:MAG: hypothetical protein M1832_001969 [Thelocarpon impressellum]
MTYATSSPAATTAGQGNSPPTCQNCTTSTTPLWRRDEIGSVLCNACGLFLKLHGRPRPISLKTDVIKSRNRVKSSGQGPRKKSLFDSNGLSSARSNAGTPPPGSLDGHRRTSQKTSSGTSNGSNSPLSRTGTPAFTPNSHLGPPAVFDGASLVEHGFHPSPSLPGLHLSHPSPGSTSSFTDRGHERPPTYESIVAANTSLKTRVSELEVINDLYQSRVTQLEQEANARRGDTAQPESDPQQRAALDEARRRESELKRRVEELERELADARDGGHRAKKMRLSDIVDDGAASTP